LPDQASLSVKFKNAKGSFFCDNCVSVRVEPPLASFSQISLSWEDKTGQNCPGKKKVFV